MREPGGLASGVVRKWNATNRVPAARSNSFAPTGSGLSSYMVVAAWSLGPWGCALAPAPGGLSDSVANSARLASPSPPVSNGNESSSDTARRAARVVAGGDGWRRGWEFWDADA